MENCGCTMKKIKFSNQTKFQSFKSGSLSFIFKGISSSIPPFPRLRIKCDGRILFSHRTNRRYLLYDHWNSHLVQYDLLTNVAALASNSQVSRDSWERRRSFSRPRDDARIWKSLVVESRMVHLKRRIKEKKERNGSCRKRQRESPGSQDRSFWKSLNAI